MSKTSDTSGAGGELHQRSKVDLTSNQGTVLSDNQNSLKAGVRGPSLLEDFLLREKITHFDHERIPERIVHARGTGAKGKFQVYESLADITKAAFLQDPKVETEAFVRFSTVAGGAGSNDTVRDVRGFAVKLYTSEGNFDLVGNNIPVFFIQDAMKFPDLVHSVKMEPDRAFPQAASAHDTFWDFVSLMPETLHMVTWAMSDRAIPRSYRMMDGFGVHTFRLINAKGEVQLVKFHWRPVLGTASFVWNEAVKLQGADPDFHRRDLWTAIENGDFPEWELGLQVFEEERAAMFDFDVLDPTKLIPEEIVPVRIVGKLTLDRNVDNFFAETEQVAFHPGHIVPGIDFTEDPLLQGRLHSYLDTQLSRLGGPNFHEIPVNRPRCPMHNFQRDGIARQDVAKGRVAYEPNSLAPDGPRANPDKGFASARQTFGGAERVRERSPSFADHYSQARLFFQSQTPIEQDHIVDAFSFELAKVETPAIRQRVLGHLHIVDETLGKRVQENLGEKDFDHSVKAAVTPKNLPASPALSLLDRSKGTLKGRVIGVLVSDGAPADLLASVKAAAKKEGAKVQLVAPRIGGVKDDKGADLTIDHTVDGGPSVIFDHVVVAPGKAALDKTPAAIDWVRDAFGHGKVIGHTAGASALLKAAHVKASADRGVVALTSDAGPFVKSALEGRVWDRQD